LWTTNMRRQSSRPRFIDKMPNNWLHLGLILTILPNARIIDARRDSTACGWSLFRQKFASGQDFSYDLDDITHFAADNRRMMDHFDRLFPGRIHRILYEAFVAEPKAQLQSLLDYLDLPFKPECLDFHRNPRTVRTSSSEQVRRPLNRDGIDSWRPYSEWLTRCALPRNPACPASSGLGSEEARGMLSNKPGPMCIVCHSVRFIHSQGANGFAP
jgi:Sulfotransferase family